MAISMRREDAAPQSTRSSQYNLRRRSPADGIPTAQQQLHPLPHASPIHTNGGEAPSKMGAASGVSSTPPPLKKRTLGTSDYQISTVGFSTPGRSSPSTPSIAQQQQQPSVENPGSVAEGREGVITYEVSLSPSRTKKPRIGFSNSQSQQDGISISRRISTSTASILPLGSSQVYNLRSRRGARRSSVAEHQNFSTVDEASRSYVIALPAGNPQTSSFPCNFRREETAENSRGERRNSVVLQVYCRRRMRHVNEIHELGSSNSPSPSSDLEENITVISEDTGARLESDQPRAEMRDRERQKEEFPTSSISESLQPEGEGKKECEIFGQPLSSAYIDFEDFKTVRKIELNQIWALNDGFSWAPRTYAKIHKFLPSELKVEVALLNFHPTCDEDASWLEENLPVVCGTFRVGKSMLVRDVSNLSHRVDCEEEETERSFHKILPRKGEVWAIYKDWNAEWLHSDYKRHSDFKLVEIMSDFSEEDGIFVAALAQADGCLTIFQRQMHEGFGLFQWISKRGLVRFSHRVVAVGMGGDGKTGIPKGSWMIDPIIAPIPFNLDTSA